MGDSEPIEDLEQQRASLYAELIATGDFRRGSVTENYRRCGKPNCACAQPDHPGHGPRLLLTRSVQGRTKGRQLAPEEVEKVRAEVAAYEQFTELTRQVIDVNEAICETRPARAPTAATDDGGGTGDEKGGSRAHSSPS